MKRVFASYQVREGAMSDLQTQLREVLRENELLRREVHNPFDSRIPSAVCVCLKINKEKQQGSTSTRQLHCFFSEQSHNVTLW